MQIFFLYDFFTLVVKFLAWMFFSFFHRCLKFKFVSLWGHWGKSETPKGTTKICRMWGSQGHGLNGICTSTGKLKQSRKGSAGCSPRLPSGLHPVLPEPVFIFTRKQYGARRGKDSKRDHPMSDREYSALPSFVVSIHLQC